MEFLTAGNPRYVHCFYKHASPSLLLPRALLEPTGFPTHQLCVHIDGADGNSGAAGCVLRGHSPHSCEVNQGLHNSLRVSRYSSVPGTTQPGTKRPFLRVPDFYQKRRWLMGADYSNYTSSEDNGSL